MVKSPRNGKGFEQKLFLVSAELSGDETSGAVQPQKPRVWGKVACKNHESNRGKWSDSLCKGWSQVHTVDQTVRPPNKHSFVSQRLLVGRWPPVVVSETKVQDPLEQGLTHTSGRSRRKCMKGRWLLFFSKIAGAQFGHALFGHTAG